MSESVRELAREEPEAFSNVAGRCEGQLRKRLFEILEEEQEREYNQDAEKTSESNGQKGSSTGGELKENNQPDCPRDCSGSLVPGDNGSYNCNTCDNRVREVVIDNWESFENVSKSDAPAADVAQAAMGILEDETKQDGWEDENPYEQEGAKKIESKTDKDESDTNYQNVGLVNGGWKGRFVYLIRSDSGYCKIGISNSPKRRVDTLQTGHYEQLELVIAVGIDEAESMEKRLHKQYKPENKQGEWFELGNKDIANVIRQLKTELELQTGMEIDFQQLKFGDGL